ncbi:MAG TPA: glycosyltransferase family 4 protein, partial [Planctomycetota bacterium]|nr:glycosyltransferase family 4 protein [Planctomycetota bacterium]
FEVIVIGGGPDLEIMGAGGDARLPALQTLDTGKVRIKSQTPRAETLELIASSRALVFPSEWQEPFGLSIIEAMALSKPVIASRVAGPKDIVEDGVTGFLFQPGDVDELADCMKRLQDNPDLAVELGRAGRARYEKEYSPDAGYARMLENYRRLGLSIPS